MAYQQHRHSIFDAMEHKGVFKANTANAQAIDLQTGLPTYQRQEYPKMLYHPAAETRVLVPGEEQVTVGGRVLLRNEQTEVIHRIVGSAAEEDRLLAQGWHTSLAKTLRENGVVGAPPESPAEAIQAASQAGAAAAELAEAKLQAMQAEMELMKIKLAELEALAD